MSSLKESPVKAVATLMSSRRELASSKQKGQLPIWLGPETTQWLRTACPCRDSLSHVPWAEQEEMYSWEPGHPVICYKLLERNELKTSLKCYNDKYLMSPLRFMALLSPI